MLNSYSIEITGFSATTVHQGLQKGADPKRLPNVRDTKGRQNKMIIISFPET